MVRYYSHWPRRSSPADDLASAAGAGVILFAVALLLLVFWLIARAAKLVNRVLQEHPESRALRVALGVCLLLWVLAGAMSLAAPSTTTVAVAVALAVAGVLGVVLAAAAVDTFHDHLFRRLRTKETLVGDILLRSWWEDAA